MSAELTALFLVAAFIAFVVAAVLSWTPSRPATFLAIGLACWVFVSMVPALRAI